MLVVETSEIVQVLLPLIEVFAQYVEVKQLRSQFQIPVISVAVAALLAGVRPYISSSVRSTS